MATTARTSIELLRYAAAMRKREQPKCYYIHDCFIHPGQGHSSWNDGPQDFGGNDINVIARDKESLEK